MWPYISNQNQLFFFKNQNKAGKKQNKLEIFEKTAGNASSNRGGLFGIQVSDVTGTTGVQLALEHK